MMHNPNEYLGAFQVAKVVGQPKRGAKELQTTEVIAPVKMPEVMYSWIDDHGPMTIPAVDPHGGYKGMAGQMKKPAKE